MADYDITTPVTEEQVRSWRINDTVTLNGTLYGIRDRTQIQMFDHGRKTRFDLNGHAVIHTAPNVRKVQPTDTFPAGYAPLCIGTTTSARMSRFTEGLLRDHHTRAIMGKGGLLPEALSPLREHGGVYLSVVGGAAALETTQIEEIEQVEWEDLMPECLWRFRVRDFGPLIVGMDSHGESLYENVQAEARRRLEQSIYERL